MVGVLGKKVGFMFFLVSIAMNINTLVHHIYMILSSLTFHPMDYHHNIRVIHTISLPIYFMLFIK
jgi:hypothetical protein